ncbi:MAG: hypothetical protein K2O41_00665 [Clostridia bacterium]|nr:hypothetical protein [Clostridia bacterium]
MNKKIISFLLLAIIVLFICIFIISIIDFAQVWCQDFMSSKSEFSSDEFKIFAMKWFSVNLIIVVFELFILSGLIIVLRYVFNSELKDTEKRLQISKDRKEKHKQERREKLLKQLKELEESSKDNY